MNNENDDDGNETNRCVNKIDDYLIAKYWKKYPLNKIWHEEFNEFWDASGKLLLIESISKELKDSIQKELDLYMETNDVIFRKFEKDYSYLIKLRNEMK